MSKNTEPQRLTMSRPQFQIYRATQQFRFVTACAGRRFGKSHITPPLLLKEGLEKPGYEGWYVAPTYRMAKRIVWRLMNRVIPPAYIATVDTTDLTIELINGSLLSLRGADNPDSLRGSGLDRLIMDEAADIDQSAWFEVLLPALADKQGKALFIGTPKGYNWFYEVHTLHDPAWAHFAYTTLQGGRVTAEELALARRFMDERIYRQEFEASFETLAGRVYWGFLRKENATEVEDIPGQTLLIGLDFNVAPMSAVVGVKAGDELHIFDEIVLMDANTEMMAQEIRRRFPNRKIWVYPDPSGNSRKTSAPAGQTDFTILERYGFEVIADRSAPPVVDRMNEVNAMLCNADGRRRLLIHPRCTALIKCMEGLTYKEGTNQPDKSLNIDHSGDALGYLVHEEFPILNNQIGLGKVIWN